MTEAEIVSQIIKWLKQQPLCWAWKIVAHPRQRSGIPDVLCVFQGLFVAFEVKRPDARRGTTELQQYALGKIEEAQGFGYVVTSLREVKEIIRGLEVSEARARKKSQKRGKRGANKAQKRRHKS